MRATIIVLFFVLLSGLAHSQDINGKWYGKITQIPGGYSELYDIQLDITQKKSLFGNSVSTMANAVDIRFGFFGRIDGDSIRIEESKKLLIQDVIVPEEYHACVKNINVAYRQVGTREYLQGWWNGVSKDDSSDVCLPGSVILARNKEDLKYFIDSIHSEILKPVETTEPPVDFSAPFLNTAVRKAQEIEVHNRDIKLQVRDYLNVDNDTISIYLNREPIVRNVWLSKRSKTITLHLNTEIALNEVLIYAENLGQIPPNTSEMFLTDGRKTYRLLIESDKQKTAAIYLKYSP
ncbi:MAG: hypothetical protein K0S09_2126 [Sphingobacteriaceae bacterium]|jgi:hypothetical protein|nr:hypothetical protein [Sphingobacteriaceae bacterium]